MEALCHLVCAERNPFLQTIRFDDFQVWEGRCTPEDEPFTQALSLPKPTWDNMRSDLNAPTVLLAEVVGKTAFAGGGCIKFEVLNTADSICNQFELEINIRPSWGTLLKKDDGKPNFQKLTPIEIDDEAGVQLFVMYASLNTKLLDSENKTFCTSKNSLQTMMFESIQDGSRLAPMRTLTSRQAWLMILLRSASATMRRQSIFQQTSTPMWWHTQLALLAQRVVPSPQS